MRNAPKSRLVLSVCKSNTPGETQLEIVHMNATLIDLDLLIEQLQNEREKMLVALSTGNKPQFSFNKVLQ